LNLRVSPFIVPGRGWGRDAFFAFSISKVSTDFHFRGWGLRIQVEWLACAPGKSQPGACGY
jgi:hypothetical protein